MMSFRVVFIAGAWLAGSAAAVPVAEQAPPFGASAFATPGSTMPGDRAFRFTSEDGMLDLGDLPGGADLSSAHGIDGRGHFIVGESSIDGGVHAFRWTNDHGMSDLGDLPGGAISSVARAVNTAGIAVGRGHGASGSRAVLWPLEGDPVDLHHLAAPPEGLVLTEAYDIDEDGRILGHAEDEAGTVHVFTYELSTGQLKTAPLVEGLRFAKGASFGADGTVLGHAVTAKGERIPAVWSPGEGAELLGDGIPSGTVTDGNGAGLRVGQMAGADGPRAVLWDASGAARDLNAAIDQDLDVTLIEARAIAEDGSILAYGQAAGALHFYVLTPTDAPLAPQRRPSELHAVRNGAAIPPHTGPDYLLADLAAFRLTSDPPPALALGPESIIVGGCDLLAEACTDLGLAQELLAALDEDITNFTPLDDPGVVLGYAALSFGPGGVPHALPIRADSGPGTVLSSQVRGGTPIARFTPQSRGGSSANLLLPGTSSPVDMSTSEPGGSQDTDPATIPAVPLPPAGAMFLAAMGLLGWLGWRRRVL